MTSPLRAFGPLEPDRDGWEAAAVALSRPAVALAAQGPEAMPVTMSNHSHAENWFELLTRPLWGLTGATGPAADDLWPVLARTLARALDPRDPWYVGEVTHASQRCVEAAAVGRALATVPEKLWEPLAPKDRDNVAAWLSRAYVTGVVDNNWHYFPVFAGHGLKRLGIAHDPAVAAAHLDRIGEMSLGDGAFGDGPVGRVDYYNPFAFHTYALLHAAISGDDRYVEHAAAFARRFRSWFAADGSAVPYGRSMGYRFAQASLWGALAAADVEAVPWAEAAGYARRHLQWWWDQPILDPAGRLTVGYAYPNDAVVEQYLTAGSPWWANKVFLGLDAPAAHPFWTAEAAVPGPAVEPHPAARAVHVRDVRGHVTRLNGQARHPKMRGGRDAYAKFAYSSLAGFSRAVEGPGLDCFAPDGGLALSEDGVHWRGREDPEDGRASEDGVVTVTWRPWADVTVTTTVTGTTDGRHTRVHEIETGRTLHTGEGGWCVPQPGAATEAAGGRAFAVSQGLRSEIVDEDGTRTAAVIAPMPGTHLYWPATVLPVLSGVLEPGHHRLSSVIYIGNEVL